ncbi:MAG: phosphotransferase [Acholeplasmatales bacterium]
MILTASKKYLKKPKIEYRLLGGMSNYTYVVSDNNKKYVVRVLGKDANLFVHRNEEAYHIKMFENLNITNKTLYFDLATGVKVTEYVKGDILSQINTLDYLSEVSDILKIIHNSPKSKYDYDLFNRLVEFEAINKDIPKVYYEIKAWALKEKETTYKNVKLTFTHGDSQPSNFVVGKDKVYVVDFEFSGNNDPYYDIACFGNIHFEYALALLDVYLGRKANAKELKRLYYNRIIQALQWSLVAKYKHEVGMSEELQVPFDKLMNDYLNLGLKLKNEYEHLR